MGMVGGTKVREPGDFYVSHSEQIKIDTKTWIICNIKIITEK